MHYMTEDSARRRVRQTSNGHGDGAAEMEKEYSDEGKDVYNKNGYARIPPVAARPRRPVAPPATNIVRSKSSRKYFIVLTMSSKD